MQPNLPLYLDLQHVVNSGGIPFTLSSNLLSALTAAEAHNMNQDRYEYLGSFADKIYELLKPLGVMPFAVPGSRVFTIVLYDKKAAAVANQLYQSGIQLSWQSNYLIKKNWLQLAVFGTYTNAEMDYVLECLKKLFSTAS
jgi:hypothetical protein